METLKLFNILYWFVNSLARKMDRVRDQTVVATPKWLFARDAIYLQMTHDWVKALSPPQQAILQVLWKWTPLTKCP